MASLSDAIGDAGLDGLIYNAGINQDAPRLEEITVPEVARRLDLPVGTAASRLRRAREAFSRASRDARGTLTG